MGTNNIYCLVMRQHKRPQMAEKQSPHLAAGESAPAQSTVSTHGLWKHIENACSDMCKPWARTNLQLACCISTQPTEMEAVVQMSCLIWQYAPY